MKILGILIAVLLSQTLYAIPLSQSGPGNGANPDLRCFLDVTLQVKKEESVESSEDEDDPEEKVRKANEWIKENLRSKSAELTPVEDTVEEAEFEGTVEGQFSATLIVFADGTVSIGLKDLKTGYTIYSGAMKHDEEIFFSVSNMTPFGTPQVDPLRMASVNCLLDKK